MHWLSKINQIGLFSLVKSSGLGSIYNNVNGEQWSALWRILGVEQLGLMDELGTGFFVNLRGMKNDSYLCYRWYYLIK